MSSRKEPVATTRRGYANLKRKEVSMKRILMLIALAVMVGGVAAQDLVIGEKAPDFKVKEWYALKKPAATPHKMMLVEFFHPSNRASVERLGEINGWAKKYPSALTVVVIAKEDTPEVRELLKSTLAHGYAGFDDAGRTFEAFGVHYVPYGVLIDPKGRVLWMGNSTGMTEKIIENHIENGVYKDRSLRKTPQAGKGR